MPDQPVMVALRPFTQLDDRYSRGSEGTGLGLPLSLGLMRLHGGTLHIESQPGAGTTVVLYLPGRGAAAPSLTAKLAQGRAA